MADDDLSAPAGDNGAQQPATPSGPMSTPAPGSGVAPTDYLARVRRQAQQSVPQGTASEAIATEEEESRVMAESQGRLGQIYEQRSRPYRRQPAPEYGPVKPTSELTEEELRERYLSGPQDNGVELLERWRLNQQEAFYRGTSSGAARLSALASIFTTPDGPDTPPERKAVNEELRKEYQRVVADLAAYDEMQSFSTTLEAVTALGAQVTASMAGPESWLGWRVAGSLAHGTLQSIGQQAAISAAVDPLVQGLNIQAGVQDQYNVQGTLLAGALGGLIGGGAHMLFGGAGIGVDRFMGQVERRSILNGLAQQDLSFSSPWLEADMAMAEGRQTPYVRNAPEQVGAPQMPTVRRPPPEPEPDVPPPPPPRAPDYSFDEAVRAAVDDPFALDDAMMESIKARAFEDEVGPGLRRLIDEYEIPPEHADEIMKFYTREEGEPVERATQRAIDDWVSNLERAEQAAIDADPVLQRDLQEARPPASKDLPPEDWVPDPTALAEAKRLARGWSPQEIGKPPQSLVSFVRKNGGLRMATPEAAEMLAQDLGRQPGLLRTQKGGGKSVDTMAQMARDNGYDLGAELAIGSGIDADRFLRMLLEDAGGRRKHYPRGADTEGYFKRLQYADQIINYLKEVLGVNPKGMDPRHVAWLLSQERANAQRSQRDVLGKGSGFPEGRGAQPGEAQDIPFPGEGEPAGRGGGGREAPGAERQQAPAAPAAGGGSAGGAQLGRGAGEPVGGDVTPERIAAARAAMPEDVRAEFDMLVAMGAAKKAASQKDEQAFLKLLDQYAPQPSRAGADVRPEVKAGPAEPGILEERPLLDTKEATPEELAARERARQKEEAEARMRGRQRSGVGQESADDTPLFGGERQKDIFGVSATSIAGAAKRRWSTAAKKADRFLENIGEPALPENPIYALTVFEEAVQYNRKINGDPANLGVARDIFEEMRAANEAMYRMDENHPARVEERWQKLQQAANDPDVGPVATGHVERQKMAKPLDWSAFEQSVLETWPEKMTPPKARAALRKMAGRMDDQEAAVLRKMADDDGFLQAVSDFKNRSDDYDLDTDPDRESTALFAAFQQAIRKEASGNASALMGGTGERPDLEALAQRRRGGALFNEQDRPDVGIPEANRSPQQEVAIRSLYQQAMDLAQALDIPIRQGRVEARGAIATYNRRSGVIRTTEIPDFEAAAHEAGHGLENIMGQELTNLTQVHGYELGRLDYDQNPATGMRANEGFAEFIRLFIGQGDAVRNYAPTFYPEFINYMETRRPDLLAALRRAHDAYRAYNEATSVDAVGAVRQVRHEDPTLGERITEGITDLPNTIRTVLIKGYETLLDSNNDMSRAVRQLGRLIREQEGGPVRLEDAYNPDVLLRLFPRSQQAAIRDMIDGVRGYREVTPMGVSLRQAMSYALNDNGAGWGKWDREGHAQFSTYLIAKRAEVLWRRFQDGDLPNPPVAFSHGDAIQAVADLEAANPRLRLAADMVHQYSRNLLDKLHDAGMITADLHAKLTAEEFYVPFMRDLSDKPIKGSGFGQAAEGPGATAVIKRIRGSSRDIFDPIESLMLQTFLVNRAIQHNDIITSLVALSRRAGAPGGRFAEPVPAHEMHGVTFDLGEAIRRKADEIGMAADEAEVFVSMMSDLAGEDPLMGRFFRQERTTARGEPIVFYREGGEVRAVRLSSNKEEGQLGLYELLTQAPPAATDVFHNLASMSALATRGGITTAPAYLIANFVRDQVAAAILRSDYVPFYHGARGIADEWTQANNAILYGYAGGVAGGASVGPVERAAEANVNALRAQGYLVTRLGDGTVSGTVKGALEIASSSEAGTRNSIFRTVYEAGLRRGLSEHEAMVEAAFQAQDILDFSRHGSRTMALRNWVPFFNAHLQGLDKARRTMIDPIVRQIREGAVFQRDTDEFRNAVAAWMKAGAIGAGLGAVYAALNYEKDAYRNASPYFKGTHLVVPMGDKEVAVIPKPFELSLGFTLGEYAFAMLARNDERAAGQFLEAAYEVIMPPTPWTGMPITTLPAELRLGRSMFTGRDIVPDRLKGLPPEMQYDDRTSGIAKYLGGQLGMSPAKIDYAIGSQFGTWGRDVMALTSGVNADAPAKSWYDVAILRRFIKDPTRSSDATTQFWKFMARETGEYNRAVSGYDQLVKEFREDEAQALLAKMPTGQKVFATLKSAADEDGRPAFKADDRRLHPLQRAYDAVTTLNGLRTELVENRFSPYSTGERLRLPPEARRDLLENVRELSQIEMANALVMLDAPGYKGLPILDVNDTMAKIRHISPEVADEIAARYATAKVYKTGDVYRAWPRVRDQVARLGSRADLLDQRQDVTSAGYEFDAERTRKPMKRRVFVAPTP